MRGIDLNQPIEYCYASMRYFKEGEHHVNRICPEDVLLLVYDGVLRVEEDGVSCEIRSGEYHIQRSGSLQRGVEASDSPKYMYIHFNGVWADEGNVLAENGTFSCENMFELMEKMDYQAHNDYSRIECCSVFFQILVTLYQTNRVKGLINKMADYIVKNVQKDFTLEDMSHQFGYSKNHIINLFKNEYGVTPGQYLIKKRIEKAQWLLESTGDTLEIVAEKCGFSDYSHFYKAFLKANGRAPGQWKREKQAYPYRDILADGSRR